MTAPTGSTLSAYAQPYSYDNLDRITNSTAGSYTYGDSTHDHAVTGLSSIPNQYAAYDAMGNMTCRNVDITSGHTCGGSMPTGATMGYDADGQLVNWNAPSGTVGSAHYLYDNAGNRVLTNSVNASSTTDTIYFDGYTETVLSGGTTTTTKYYNANGTRIAVRVGATFPYLLSNPLGSNSIALNSTGQVIAVQHYSPYGTVDYSWGTMPTSYSYTGQRLDSQTGLLYYNFRYYDPVSGRFVRTDTTQNNTSGMDPYAYVGDNPESHNDPTGHCWPLCTAIAGAILGAVIGGAISYAQQAGSGKPINWGEVAGAAANGAILGGVAGALGPVVITAGAGLIGGAGVSAVAAVTTVSATTAIETRLTVGGVVGTVAGAAIAANGSDGGVCSFTSNTLVTTGDGKKPIGTLQTGDKVLAYNPKTHTMELQPILHVWVHTDNDLVDVTLTTTMQKGGKTSQQKEQLHTTSEHPFLTKERGFLPAGQLKPGMHVMRADGSFGVVTDWKLVLGTAVMYNLTVQQDHTFVVGVDQWVVHNTCIDTDAILKRLRTQVKDYRGNQQLVTQYGLRKTNPDGSPGRGVTNSISELYDSNGRLIARGISNNQIDDPLFDDVRCSEGFCLINGRTQLQRGQTYDLFTAQLEGKPACPACMEDIQKTADAYGVTINVYSIDANGNPVAPVPYTPSAQPTPPEDPQIVEDM